MSFDSLTLVKELEKYSVYNAEDVAIKMLHFMQLVLDRNESVNLTAITDKQEFIDRHLIDSIACYGWTEIEKSTNIVDVGTGAGLPGIPLAICYPEKSFTLLDSLRKRIDFLNEAISALGLKNVKAVHSRAEDAGRNPDMRERFDLCVTRAVAPLNVLLEYCLPLVKPGGSLYAYKTKKAITEIEDSALALRLLGGSLDVQTRAYDSMRHEVAQECSNTNDSPYSLNIFIVEKTSTTPDNYPRKAGTPKKIPL